MSDFLNEVLQATTDTLSGAAQTVAAAPAPVAVAAPKTVPTVDKAFLLNLLNSSDPNVRMHTVGRALVVLFKNQTDSEKAVNATRLNNGEGFTSADAYKGTLTAKSYLKNKTLTDWQVRPWLKGNRLLKYWRQLDNAAKAKAASNA